MKNLERLDKVEGSISGLVNKDSVVIPLRYNFFMSFISENEFEQQVIKRISKLGWKYLSRQEVLHLRNNDTTTVILEAEIKKFLKKQNLYSEQIINEALKKIRRLHDSDVEIANQAFQKMIVEGVKVKDEINKKTVSVQLFDFDNTTVNDFVITNQFMMKTKHLDYKYQYPDVVLYINGLPLVVMELKKPLSEIDSIEDAYKQVKNYQNYLSDLFTYNAFNVISNFTTTKFGTLTSSLGRYAYWRGEDFNSPSENIFDDIFKKDVILDLIKNFTFWTNEEKTVKIISGYHQYYGVKNIVESSINSKDGKGGIYWHTQGSGKSFSMLFYVRNMSVKKKGSTFIIVTDRNDLDIQLSKTFANASEFIGQKIHQIKSINELKIELNGVKQNGVFFTTVQKFRDDIQLLSLREDIYVITDEAHRSHNQIDVSYKINTETGAVKEKFGNSKIMRDAFPNATFLGFTGTPIENEDKSTSRIFGDIKTKYLMKDAENDGVIVPILYESRKPELSFDEKHLNELDDMSSEYTERVAKNSSLPGEIRKKINKITQALSNFVLDPDRIEGIATDFVEHYLSKKDQLKGKAMFVALNRKAAFEYYKKIIEIEPSLKKNIKLIVTEGDKRPEDSELNKLSGNSNYRKDMAIEFKKPNSDFKIAIVVDMWLTGFDVPALDLLYLDKPIKMHNLMQAIARTNRVYYDKEKNIVKDSGLIVDYIGIWKKLNEALAYYSGVSKTEINKISNINTLKEEAIKQAKMVKNTYFPKCEINGSNFSKSETYRFDILREATDEVLSKHHEMHQAFVIAAKIVGKHLKDLITVLDEEERVIFQLITTMRSYIIKLELDKMDFMNIKMDLLNQLNKTIKFNRTISINEDLNKEIKLSDIINFVLANDKEDTNITVEEKVSATRKLIRDIRAINVVLAKKLKISLEELMKKYNENYISLSELKEGLFAIALEAKDQNDTNNIDKYGFTPKQKAFFNILLEPVKELSQFDEDMIADITKELLEIINNDKLVNKQWMFNESMIRRVRATIQELLIKYDYPPSEAQASSKNISEQIIEQNDYRRS